MAISAAGIIFSNLNNNTLSRLTRERTVAAIPFACRYRLIDFAISNMVNAGVTNLNIVANYNYRSLVEHIGSGKDYDLARRNGGINFISPLERGADRNYNVFSSRMEALKNMIDYIYDFKEEYVVLTDSDTVLNIDLKDVIHFHENNKATITFITKLISVDYVSKSPRMMISKEGNRIIDITMNTTYNPDCPELALNMFVIKTEDLKRIIELASAHGINSLSSILLSSYRREGYYAYSHNGYVATVSSLQDYYMHSIDLTKNEKGRNSLLGNKELPIYTRVKNSAPTLYTETAKVKSSIIADDCIIEGKVTNSIIFRGVHVAKDAVVNNSILFHGTTIDTEAKINSVITDKYVTIGRGVELCGNYNLPFYIEKYRKI